MRAFLARLRDCFRRRAIARDFEEETAFHLAELEATFQARGMSPEEARHQARREFGQVSRAREDLRSQAGFPSADELIQDGRHAWRGILRRPMLAISIVAILTLGLGAAATIHGLINAVFLRPLPVPHPEELYAMESVGSVPNRISRGTVQRLEAALPADSVAAYGGGGRVTVQGPGREAMRASVRLVNGGFFRALGVGAGSGRLLTPADDVPGAPSEVAVVSAAWATKVFGSAEAAVGREIAVNRVPLTVVGVLPGTFRDIAVGQTTDLWLAAALQPRVHHVGNASIIDGDDRANHPDWNREERVSWLQLLVRVRPGTPAANAALQQAWAVQRDDLLKAFGEAQGRDELRHATRFLVPAPGGQSHFRDGFRSTGWLLGGVAAVMLVIVCANVSGLLLVRAMSRHREIGVRLALGAGSFRIVRLGFLEALLLSGLGAIGGALLAALLLPATVRLLAPGQDLAATVGWSTVAMMAGLAGLTAVCSAFAPALWISRVEPLRALSGRRGLGQAPVRLGRALVVAQFALAVALVAVATALGEELQRALAADPGFDREQVVTALFDAAGAGYDDRTVVPLLQRVRAAALAVPGVQSVSFSSSGLLAGSRDTSGIYVRDPRARVSQRHTQYDVVLPGYFAVVGMPILRGRDVTDGDAAGMQRVAVINAAFAREIFGDVDPLGQTFGYNHEPAKEDFTVVGVVSDARINGVRGNVPAMFYVPAAQRGQAELHFLAVRFTGPAAAVQQSLRAALARVEPALVFTSWRTLEQRMTDDLGGDVATTRLAGVFGGCALLLAGAGVAGSLGYLVVLRQRELALRMAIGAEPGAVLRSVLGDAMRLALAGSIPGLLAVWLVPMLPAVAGALHGRPGLVPGAIAAGVALLTAAVAGWFPARRASRIDPLLLLKAE